MGVLSNTVLVVDVRHALFVERDREGLLENATCALDITVSLAAGHSISSGLLLCLTIVYRLAVQ